MCSSHGGSKDAKSRRRKHVEHQWRLRKKERQENMCSSSGGSGIRNGKKCRRRKHV
jgi:hypothetical protein